MQIVEFVHIEQVNSAPESSELIDADLACLQQAIREPSMVCTGTIKKIA